MLIASPLRNFDSTLRGLGPIQQAMTAVLCLLTIQYTANYVAYFELLPRVLGKDPNGIIINQIYLLPGLLALFFSFYFQGDEGIRKLFRPYKKLRIHYGYWMFAALAMYPILYFALFMCDWYLGEGLRSHELMWVGWAYFPTYLPQLIVQAISDELFWIGFVLPRMLQGGLPPFKAALIIALLWALDYVAFGFTGFNIAEGVAVHNIVIGTFALAPWYIWLRFRTGSAIILVMFNVLTQISQNTVPILPQDTGGSNIEATFCVVTFFIIGMFIWKFFPVTQNQVDLVKNGGSRPKHSQ